MGLFRYLLKTQIAIMPENQDFFLIIGQIIHKIPDILLDLIMNDLLFNGVCGKFPRIEQVLPEFVLGNGIHLFFVPEMINDQVMRNAYHPGKEFAVIPVPSFMQGTYYLDKGILKDIFRQVFILDQEQYIRIYLFSVP
jgi:hypothetical protein